MSDVLEEVTDAEVTAAHVKRRVDDWARRIDELYAQIEGWLPAGWHAERQRTVRMDEKMMRRFGIPPRDLPILDLWHGGSRAATIEPRNLWTIGTNGRLDLIHGTDHHVIVDVAQSLAPPSWHIAPLARRRSLEPFDQGRLKALLQA
jgi:hypothetical protein